jgi:hypothetical protein
MRVLVALNDAADRGEFSKDIVEKAADRLWTALWTENKNTSEESVMAEVLDPILPGGWEKWKYVCLEMGTEIGGVGCRCQNTTHGIDERRAGYGVFWGAMVDYYEF